MTKSKSLQKAFVRKQVQAELEPGFAIDAFKITLVLADLTSPPVSGALALTLTCLIGL